MPGIAPPERSSNDIGHCCGHIDFSLQNGFNGPQLASRSLETRPTARTTCVSSAVSAGGLRHAGSQEHRETPGTLHHDPEAAAYDLRHWFPSASGCRCDSDTVVGMKLIARRICASSHRCCAHLRSTTLDVRHSSRAGCRVAS
jgi:hypothetical protein